MNTKIQYALTNKAEFDRKNSAFVCIDLQEKLFAVMKNKEKLKINAQKLLKASELLGVLNIICEQYPKGLGSSVVQSVSNTKKIEKLTFSAFGEQSFLEILQKDSINTLILFGIESHICVRSTALDAKRNGFRVVVVGDAISSRSKKNHKLCLEELRAKGVEILSTESVLFSFLWSCKEADFKNISPLIK